MKERTGLSGGYFKVESVRGKATTARASSPAESPLGQVILVLPIGILYHSHQPCSEY